MWGFGGLHHKRGLRGLVVFLLARGPKNGAELIEEVDRLTMGHWHPSPGSVYPLLEELVQSGAIQKRPDGRYEVSARSRDEFSFFRGWMAAPRTPEEMLNEISGYVRYLEDLATSDPKGDWKQHREELRGLAQRLEQLAK
jgi:DNA-binding PadR family transcriptional regulator